MILKGSKTEEKLRQAFVRELHARANYTYFADAARQARLEQVADLFSATAQNEAEHAAHEFSFLGGAGDTMSNLKLAIEREHKEATELYPEAAQVAEDETLDCIGLYCPMPIAHTAKKMKELKAGQVLEVLSDDQGIKEDMPNWCKMTGNELISIEEEEGVYRVFVKKSG